MRRQPEGVPPATLVAAVGLVVAETSIEIPYVVSRSELVPGLRASLAVLLAIKLVLCALALRRSAGSVLGLFLYEMTAAGTALVGTDLPGAARLGLGATAVAAIALLAASAHAFPTPELPGR